MKLLIRLLSERGHLSMMRALSAMAVSTACIIGLYAIAHNKDLVGSAALCSAFLGAGIAGKVLQKKDEQ
jgi:hypothetical protein